MFWENTLQKEEMLDKMFKYISKYCEHLTTDVVLNV